MKKYEHLKKKAIVLRRKGHSLDEISEMLSLGKTTIFYWIRGARLPATEKQRACARAAGMANKEKHNNLRQLAYKEGLQEYERWKALPTFLDFVVIYLTEGFRRTRNQVAVSNSNPSIMRLSLYWIDKLRNPQRSIDYGLQCHIDNDENAVKEFWARHLDIESAKIKVFRKSNSGNLDGRQWRSMNGVLQIRVNDTYFRAKLQAWMDLLQKEWQNRI